MRKSTNIVEIAIFAIVFLVFGVSTTQAQNTNRWEVRQIDSLPDWHADCGSSSFPGWPPQIEDTVYLTKTPLPNGNSLLVTEQWVGWPPAEDRSQKHHIDHYDLRSTLKVIRQDTMYMDSAHDFRHLRFNNDSTSLVAYRVDICFDGVVRGDVVKYRLKPSALCKDEIEVIHLRTFHTRIAVDPKRGRVAYSDCGDLFLSYNTWTGPELVYNGGGAYAYLGPVRSGRIITNICWSPNGQLLVFQLEAGEGSVVEYYEAIKVER